VENPRTDGGDSNSIPASIVSAINLMLKEGKNGLLVFVIFRSYLVYCIYYSEASKAAWQVQSFNEHQCRALAVNKKSFRCFY